MILGLKVELCGGVQGSAKKIGALLRLQGARPAGSGFVLGLPSTSSLHLGASLFTNPAL